jgi:hypothetical protein
MDLVSLLEAEGFLEAFVGTRGGCEQGVGPR